VFKEMDKILKQVRNGCLSDLPGITLYYAGSPNGKCIYTAHGSSKSEALNNSLNCDFLWYSKLGLV
jgi:hypothetical protein